MKILNLTQHTASPEQLAAGVVEPADKKAVQQLLTFDEPPSQLELHRRASVLVRLVLESEAGAAMIGGAGYLMGPLEQRLREMTRKPLHSFTRREAVEEPQPDGSVRKVTVFRHIGWVEA